MRVVRRTIAESPLLALLAAIFCLTAFGCALTPAPYHAPAPHADHWAAPPAAPQPLFARAALEPQLAPVSFPSHAPALRSSFQEPAQQRVAAEFNRAEEKRVALREFGPIYRRPPPSRS